MSRLVAYIKYAGKASAAAGAFLTVLAAALAAHPDPLDWSGNDWVQVAAAATAVLAVFHITNGPKPQ